MAKPVPKNRSVKPFNPSEAPEGLGQPSETGSENIQGSIPVPQSARTYRGSQQVDHDLFKLENALLKRNLSYGDDAPLLDHITHSHHFHTVDSSGKKLDRSTAVGGHFHAITVRRGDSGVPEITVGPPMKEVLKRQGKRKVRVAIPCTFDGQDDDGNPMIDLHTHKATYLGSEKIVLRQASIEAAKYTAAIDFKRNIPSEVEGVTGG